MPTLPPMMTMVKVKYTSPGIACTVDFRFPSPAQEKVVGEHHQELHQAAERNRHRDAKEVPNVCSEGHDGV